jgi:hypothetical protein
LESSHFNCIGVPGSGFPEGFFGDSLDIFNLLRGLYLETYSKELIIPDYCAMGPMTSGTNEWHRQFTETGYHTQLTALNDG